MAEEVKGINIQLKLTAKGVANDLRSLKKDAKNLTTEFRELEKAGKLNPTGIGNYANQIANLHKQTLNALASVNKHEEYLKAVNAAYGENSDKAKEANHQYELAKIRLDQCVSAEKNARQALFEMNGALEGNTADVNDNSEALNEASERLNAFTVAVGVAAERIASRAVQALKNLAESAYQTGSEFESAMDALSAIYGKAASSADIQDLAGYFRELGTQSAYSAEEIARNAQVLANAGYDVEQTKSSLAAINDLAVGTGESFETMATVVVDGLHAFGLEANDARGFADALAKAATSSNTNVAQMGEAFKYAGTIAGSFGYDVKDVALALGMMASNGIKGSQAGTSLRQIITRLAADTSDARTTFEGLGGQFYDSHNKALPLINVLESLRSTLGGMDDKARAAVSSTIAGQRGISALNAIVSMSDEEFQKLRDSIDDCNGQVERMAAERLDNVAGAVNILKNNWSELKIELFEGVAPALKDLAKKATELHKSDAFKQFSKEAAREASDAIKTVGKALDNLKGNINTVIGVIKAFGGVLVASMGASKAISGITTITNLVKDFGTVVSTLMSGTMPEITLVIEAIALIGTAIYAVNEIAEGVFADNHQSLIGIEGDLRTLRDSIDETSEATYENAKSVKTDYDGVVALLSELDRYVDKNGKIKEGYEERVSVITDKLANAYGVEIETLDGVIQKYDEVREAIRKTAEEQAASALSEKLGDALAESLQQQAEAVSKLQGASKEFSDAVYAYAEGETWKSLDWESLITPYIEKGEDGIETLITGLTEYNRFTEMSIDEQAQYLASHSALWDEAITRANSAMEESTSLYTTALTNASTTEEALALLRTGKLQEAFDVLVAHEQQITDLELTEGQKRLAQQQELDLLEAAARNAKTEEERAAIQERIDGIKSQISGFNEDPESKIKAEFDQEASETAISEGMTAVKDLKDTLQAEQHEAAVEQAALDATEESDSFYDAEIEETYAREEEVDTAASDVAESAVTAASDKMSPDAGRRIGADFVQGIIDGLNSKKAELEAVAAEIGRIVASASSASLEINSPSKVGEYEGAMFDEGMINGISRNLGRVKNAALSVGHTITRAMNAGVAANATLAASGASGVTINQTNNFSGDRYKQRDGVSIARQIDLMLGSNF